MKTTQETQDTLFTDNEIQQEKIPAVGYCRFSSDQQKETSIEAQKRFINDFAIINGYKIVDWYIDRAYSGKTVNRPDFQRMLNDVSAGNAEFEVVLVHKMDRFSRNASDALKYKDLLQDYGIKLVSTVEKIKNDPNGKLLFGIMSNINQYYIDNLSTEVMKGLREIALQKKWTGGIPPLGYDVINQELVINDTEAVVVRKIFEMSAEGNGYNTIIKTLNEKGYLTKAGRPFGKNSLYSILNNEKYKGTYIFNKCSRRNSENKRNSHKYKDESEIIRIENGVPAIVSEELWNKANVSRKMSSKISTNAKNDYLLTGLMYCGECGAKFHGNHRLYKDRGYNTYRCNKRTNQQKCNCKEIRADYLESFVIDNLLKYFTEPEIVTIITEETNKKIKALLNEDREDIKHAKNSLNGLEVARNNLVDAIAQQGYSQTLSDKLNSIEKQMADYKAMIDEAEKKKENISVSEDDIKKRVNALKQCMLNTDNINKTKLLLRSYIEKIIIDNNNVKIIYKVASTFKYDNTDYEVSYNHTVSEPRKELYI